MEVTQPTYADGLATLAPHCTGYDAARLDEITAQIGQPYGSVRVGLVDWLLRFASRKSLGVTMEQNEPDADGTTETAVTVWRWHREPSGGMAPFQDELAVSEGEDLPLVLLTALGNALSRPFEAVLPREGGRT